MCEVKPEITLDFADSVLGDPKGRYLITFGIGSTVDTVTFDVGWHGERDDSKAIETTTEVAKAMEPKLFSGTREIVFLSCEYFDLSQAKETQ